VDIWQLLHGLGFGDGFFVGNPFSFPVSESGRIFEDLGAEEAFVVVKEAEAGFIRSREVKKRLNIKVFSHGQDELWDFEEMVARRNLVP